MSDSFFDGLAGIDRFGDVPDPVFYSKAPSDWFVIITDVEGSTKAIEAGRYKDVNALGVSSIVALQNACEGVNIPFVFGGDGATLLCPQSHIEKAKIALRGIQRSAREGFDLKMRAGVVPVQELHDAGHEVLVARYKASAHSSLAMFAGSGIAEAETWVKDPKRGPSYAVLEDGGASRADFSGFECRWSPVQSRHGTIISLLVQAVGASPAERSLVYQKVITEVESIVEDGGRPVAEETLNLAQWPAAYNAEAALRTGKRSGFAFRAARIAIRIQTGIGRNSMDTGKERLGFDGRRYRKEVVANTDFRKFDEMLRMVLDVTAEQKANLESALDRMMSEGQLVYGLHASSTALVTCMIKSREGDHIHFVDGAEGGYALAAKVLKKRLKERL